MKDLENIRVGLMNSTSLLIKDIGNKITCSFVKEGMVKHSITVNDEMLAIALRHASVGGILEGSDFQVFRSKFDTFSLHVKAAKLYKELMQAA